MTAAKAPEMGRALDAPSGKVRLYLLYGQEESEARSYAARLARAMGPEAERVDLDAATLKADPARLADEAASFSLFGDKRFVVAQLDGDSSLPAIEALLTAEAVANPVVALAGNLKATSALLKRILNDPTTLCLACYAAKPAELEAEAVERARAEGMRIGKDVAQALVRLSGNDRTILAKEVEKLALYVDATPEEPKTAELDAVAAIGADSGEAELGRLVNAVMEGNPALAASEGKRLFTEGGDAIPILRALARRVLQLANFKVQLAEGRGMEQVLRGVFWKEKTNVERQLRQWDSIRLARAAERIAAAERATFQSNAISEVAALQELVTLSRAAQRSRG